MLKQFDAQLKDKKITVDDFKRELRRSLTVEKVLNKEITSKINVTNQDITNYYNAHKAEFNLIEPKYHFARILVTTTQNSEVHNLKNDKAQNEEEARKKILGQLTVLYKNFHNNADTGLTELIATVLSKPLP